MINQVHLCKLKLERNSNEQSETFFKAENMWKSTSGHITLALRWGTYLMKKKQGYTLHVVASPMLQAWEYTSYILRQGPLAQPRV